MYGLQFIQWAVRHEIPTHLLHVAIHLFRFVRIVFDHMKSI